jgi:hypothetical protein
VRLLPGLVTVALLAATGIARADDEIALGISYDPRIAVGGMRALVPNAALAGVQGKWEYYVMPGRLALGFDFQYHYFQHGDDKTTVAIDNGAATAPFSRYAYFITLLPTARYFVFRSSALRPWVELGVGATSATSAVLASDLSRRMSSGGIVLQPSAGVLVALVTRDNGPPGGYAHEEGMVARPRREEMFGISASVSWAFTNADVVTASNVSYVGIQLGLYSKL